MRKRLTASVILASLLVSTPGVRAAEPDSTQRLRWTPFAATIGAGVGYVFRSKAMAKQDVTFPTLQSTSANLLFTSNRTILIDTLYGKPYFGIGVYKPFYHKTDLIGNPFSIYLIYGQTVLQFGDRLTLSTEAKFGASFGWTPYNKTDNAQNRIIGAKNNYHASFDLFLRYRINQFVNTRVGATYTHFSDGAYRLPNAGLNTISGFADLMIAFKERPYLPRHCRSARKVKPHVEYDLGVTWSSRQILGQVENTSSTVILSHSFKAVDVNGYAMYTPNYYIRVGAGLHFIYDESSNVTAIRTLDRTTGTIVNSYDPSSSRERFAAGLFGKVEFPMGYINGSVGFGYILTPGTEVNNYARLNLALKTYLYRGVSTSFGIQYTPKSHSNCVFFGLGYTFGYHSLFR